MTRGARSLGKRIRQARLKQWMSQSELAESVGLTQQLLSALEGDRHLPAAEVLVKISSLLALPTDEVLSLSGRLRQTATVYMKKHPTYWTLIHAIASRQLSDAELDVLLGQVHTMGRLTRRDEPEVTSADA